MMFSSKQLLEEMPLFLSHEYDKRLLLYGNLIQWTELEKLINNRPFMSNKRFHCTKSGELSWPNKSWLTDVNTYPPQAVEEMLKLGTCYIVDCSRVNKQINELCNVIEDMVNAPTDAHIYFSQTKDDSFGKHNDKNANIIIQQEGISHAKVWKDDQLIIDEELSESRLFRFTANFQRLTGRDVADLLYLETLAIYMFALDEKQQDYGTAYARKTTQYGPYAVYRTSATDIYMLGFAINQPDYSSLKLASKDRRFLNNLNFNNRQHYMFMNKIARYTPSRSDASSYLIRLEAQLKITNPLFRQFRRLILDWADLKYSQKQYVIAKMMQLIRVKGKGSEIFRNLTAMKTSRRYDNVKP